MGNRMMRYSYNNKPEQSAELEAALDEHFKVGGIGDAIAARPTVGANRVRTAERCVFGVRDRKPPTPIKIKECE